MRRYTLVRLTTPDLRKRQILQAKIRRLALRQPFDVVVEILPQSEGMGIRALREACGPFDPSKALGVGGRS